MSQPIVSVPAAQSVTLPIVDEAEVKTPPSAEEPKKPFRDILGPGGMFENMMEDYWVQHEKR